MEEEQLKSAYPNLELLFGAYFHQDWDCEGATDDAAVVAQFRQREGREHVSDAASELGALQKLGLSEDALGEALYKLGNNYDPASCRLTYAKWLERLASMLTGSQ